MPTVLINLQAPTATGTDGPATGLLEWAPSRRYNVAGHVVLPYPFQAVLVAGAVSVVVAPSTSAWCWKVTEHVGGAGVVRYVSVPASATALRYEDLVDVDPATLAPVTSAPTVQALLDAKAALTDPRFTDARTPVAHTQVASTIPDFSAAADARVVAGITGKLDTTGLDAAVGPVLSNPASAARTALNATYAPLFGTLLGARAPLLTTHARTLLPVKVFGQNPVTGQLVGVATDTGTFRTSDDSGNTWVEKFVGPFGAFGAGIDFYQLTFDVPAGLMYAALTNGTVARAPIGNFGGVWPLVGPTVPASTTAQPFSLCIPVTGTLLYGNYNRDTPTVAAFIWRSTNGGSTWTKVLTTTARHVHAVQADPRTPGRVWAMLGDLDPGSGCYVSDNNGATWRLVASNRYGIAMGFPAGVLGAPVLVVSEGDGLNEPHLVGFPTQQADTGGKIIPLVWFDKPPSDATSNRGTARGILVTSHGDVVYFITPEAGAVGTKAGCYVAQGPTFTTSTLLEDLTGLEPPAYLNTFESGTFSINGTMRWTTPKYAGWSNN